MSAPIQGPHRLSNQQESTSENCNSPILAATLGTEPFEEEAFSSSTANVSDNIGTPGGFDPTTGNVGGLLNDHPANPTEEDLAKNILLVLNEIREIKEQIVKLDKIEATTNSLAEQLGGAVKRMAKLDSAVVGNTSKIGKLDEDVLSLHSKVGKQEKVLAGFKTLKVEITKSSAETVAQMNELIDTQRQQVDSFNSGTRRLKQDIISEVDGNLTKKIQHDISVEVERLWAKKENEKYCQSLKDQAYENRHNLILLGLPEDQNKSCRQLVQDFFKEKLGLKNLELGEVQRLGTQPESDVNYVRPIAAQFKKLSHRNSVWWKRGAVPKGEDEIQVKIQADLPKPLREGVSMLYKIARAAASLQDYSSARVRNYQLEIGDRSYQITELEDLPVQLRPSTLASLQSDTHLVFFTRHAKLSNHYPSKFIIKDQIFHSMEHFLATRRAELSGKEGLISRARNAQDSVMAKRILNDLREDHPQEWKDQIEEVAMEGLRAKFCQNRPLHDYLINTKGLILGEASRNVTWAIVMELSDPDVLDHSKWLKSGNLLGKSLMRVRAELLAESGGAPHVQQH